MHLITTEKRDQEDTQTPKDMLLTSVYYPNCQHNISNIKMAFV